MNKYLLEILEHEDYTLKLILDRLEQTKLHLYERYKNGSGINSIPNDPNLTGLVIPVRAHVHDRNIFNSFVEVSMLLDELNNSHFGDRKKQIDKINIKSLELANLVKERINVLKKYKSDLDE